MGEGRGGWIAHLSIRGEYTVTEEGSEVVFPGRSYTEVVELCGEDSLDILWIYGSEVASTKEILLPCWMFLDFILVELLKEGRYDVLFVSVHDTFSHIDAEWPFVGALESGLAAKFGCSTGMVTGSEDGGNDIVDEIDAR